jgi:Ca-activated chloride channel homolog
MDAIVLANESYNPDDAVQKEFLTIIGKARKIYAKVKKKKKDG